ncbi:hypothetical protein B0H17DRAFT_1093707 [Mycena rosella]|uniref:Uncharacterized protein n=1 Tax=Mycena rosella TaxID=1033263 RepID=A0AAD7CTK2_MYCRO|nr:hypothetical protein B0H17DRAFT_1093707 [Mycena rosella]
MSCLRLFCGARAAPAQRLPLFARIRLRPGRRLSVRRRGLRPAHTTAAYPAGRVYRVWRVGLPNRMCAPCAALSARPSSFHFPLSRGVTGHCVPCAPPAPAVRGSLPLGLSGLRVIRLWALSDSGWCRVSVRRRRGVCVPCTPVRVSRSALLRLSRAAALGAGRYGAALRLWAGSSDAGWRPPWTRSVLAQACHTASARARSHTVVRVSGRYAAARTLRLRLSCRAIQLRALVDTQSSARRFVGRALSVRARAAHARACTSPGGHGPRCLSCAAPVARCAARAGATRHSAELHCVFRAPSAAGSPRRRAIRPARYARFARALRRCGFDVVVAHPVLGSLSVSVSLSAGCARPPARYPVSRRVRARAVPLPTSSPFTRSPPA